MNIKRFAAVPVIAGAAILALAGCAGGQSIAAACTVFADRQSEITTLIQGVVTDATTGTEVSQSELDELTAIYEEMDAEISNDTIQPLLTELIAGVDELTTGLASFDAESETAYEDLEALIGNDAPVITAESELVDTCNANR